MAAHCHLMLFFGLVEIAIKHLQDCIFSVHITLMILRDDLYILFELLCLRRSHDLQPTFLDLVEVVLRVLCFDLRLAQDREYL
jgi:hypothetical protein